VLVLTGSLLDATLTGEVLFVDVSWQHRLNEAGAASVTVPLTAYAPSVADRVESMPGSTAMWIVENDGSVAWWGVIWGVDIDPEGRTINLSAATIHSVLERRILRSDLNYAQVDQATIAVGLVNAAQSGTSGDLHIDTSGVAATGVLRDRSYLGVERPALGGLLANLAKVLNGFDYDFPAVWPGGGIAPTASLRLDYPRAGRRANPLVATGNVALRGLTFDGGEVAFAVDATGDQQTVAPQTVTGSIPAGRPRLDAVISRSTVKEAQTLIDHANAWLNQHASPVRQANVTVLLRQDEALGLRVGDLVRLVETDTVGLDDDFLLTDIGVQVTGAGRQADLTLSWPTPPGEEP
jgi:hypothetical protein